MAVTSGFGIGIIAGIVSGVCYILVHGFSISRPRQLLDQWHCSICGEQFRSIEGILDSDKVVTCSKCGGKVCRKKCSIQEKENWICQTCQHPESWFKGILKSLVPSSIVARSTRNMDPNRIDEIDEDLEAAKKKEKEQVRDFIERLVEAILGGGIDNASINRIYNEKQYLPIIGQSPCSAHAGLKLIIQRVIQEAIGLPSMKKVPEHPASPSEEINRTYEDLLATAIINKVIENYQDELPTSSANSVSSQRSNISLPNNKQYFFGEETLESKWKNCNSTAGDVDTTSVSSLEEWVRSDSSPGSTKKYVDHTSLTIQHRIEEVSSSDEDGLSEERRKELQENWKLQKRQFAGNASPIPVPMLVPNPTIEAKVLIGDREADDTTDLSDAGSDYGDTVLSPGIDTKTVIGGKDFVTNVSIENQILSDASTDTSDIEEERERILEQFTSYQECRPEEAIPETINKEVIKQAETIEDTSLDSHFEQDTEYTEKYATLDRTILKCPTPIISNTENSPNTQRNGSLEDTIKETKVTTTDYMPKQNGVEHSSAEDDELKEKFKGTYSEREKQKWENAVEMKNNPYTEENINRRLSQTSNTSVTALFGRDYYIREAAKATGARKYKIDVEDMVYQKLQESSNESNTTNEMIFKAVPAIANMDSLQEDIQSPMQIASPIPSTDSDLSIERTYNLTTGKVYEKVGDIHKEIIKRTSSPEGITFRSTDTDLNQTFTVMLDENHNSTTQDRKRTFLRSLTNTDDSEEIDLSVTRSDDVFSTMPTQPISNLTDVPFVTNPKHNHLIDSVNIKSTDYVDNNKAFTIQEFSLDFSTGDEGLISTESSLNTNPDTEIVHLKEKHLVKDRLGLFSKSFCHSTPLKKTNSMKENYPKELEPHTSAHLHPSNIIDTSVTDLRKKFDTEECREGITKKHMHSLTARSISQVIRKELQEIPYDKHEETINGIIPEETIIAEIKSTVEVKTAVEVRVPEEKEIKAFPDAKSRIKFFENLNR